MPIRQLTPLAAVLTVACAVPARADLNAYIKKPETAYAWKLKEKKETEQGIIYDLHLVSQTWQDIKWEHQVQVYQPKGVEPNGTMLIWNTGGSANAGTILMAMDLAKRTKAPCAFLYHVPNQPLLDGKKEDGLIAETFVRYLKTKDESWPLLFPMVKSVVKTMDALEAFSKEEWNKPIKGFIVAGGSKRGWTSWLSATADARIKAIAPLVIDTLNMPEQMPHQFKTFGGKYSLMIHDYTNTGLVPMPKTPEAKKLWSMVDPYAYRDKLTLPKFLINGNSDPYWATDALNLYWDALKGDKWIMYVPNAGHDLKQVGRAGQSRARNGLAAFVRSQVAGKPLPKLKWKHDNTDDQLRLTVDADQVPLAARLWVAEAKGQDFRRAEWMEKPATIDKGKVTGLLAPPKEGWIAFYAELEYEIDGIRFQLSTQIRMADKNALRKPD
jgi:PhoPQ-activated pathogenicity-related protein